MRNLATVPAAMLAALALAAHADPFGVTPLRAELGSKVKSASFTVTNEGKAPLSFRVTVLKWTQDAQGGDAYAESKDLVVFPRQLEVPAGGRRLVRVGFEGAVPPAEGAYRVAIEELPPAVNLAQGRKGAVAVVGRFELPVFVKPDGAKAKLTIDSVSAKDGTFSAKVSNGGTSRARLTAITAGQAADAAAELHNPYLLAGSTREFSGPLGAGCKPGSKVTVTATSLQGVKAAKEFTLPPDACRA